MNIPPDWVPNTSSSAIHKRGTTQSGLGLILSLWPSSILVGMNSSGMESLNNGVKESVIL